MAAIGVGAETASHHGRGLRQFPGQRELGLGAGGGAAKWDWA